MPVLGWIVALVGFVGIIITVAPVVDLPASLQYPIPVWGGVCVGGLLLAMFTRRARS